MTALIHSDSKNNIFSFEKKKKFLIENIKNKVLWRLGHLVHSAEVSRRVAHGYNQKRRVDTSLLTNHIFEQLHKNCFNFFANVMMRINIYEDGIDYVNKCGGLKRT